MPSSPASRSDHYSLVSLRTSSKIDRVLLVAKTMRMRPQRPAMIGCVKHDAPSRIHMKALENIDLLPCSDYEQFGAPARACADWAGGVPFAARSPKRTRK